MHRLLPSAQGRLLPFALNGLRPLALWKRLDGLRLKLPGDEAALLGAGCRAGCGIGGLGELRLVLGREGLVPLANQLAALGNPRLAPES